MIYYFAWAKKNGVEFNKYIVSERGHLGLIRDGARLFESKEELEEVIKNLPIPETVADFGWNWVIDTLDEYDAKLHIG